MSYVSEKGRLNVHSKRWTNEQAKAQRIEYAASVPKPMKLTKEEAMAKESEILDQRRLTYGEKSGIINKKIGYRMYDINYENGDDLFEPDAIDSELEKSNVGRYTMRYIEEKPLSIEMNYSLEQDEYEMGHIYGNTITINAQLKQMKFKSLKQSYMKPLTSSFLGITHKKMKSIAGYMSIFILTIALQKIKSRKSLIL